MNTTTNLPPIRYAKTSDGVNIAYLTAGSGQLAIEKSSDAHFHVAP